MKRIICFLNLAILILFSVACAGNNGESNSGAQATPTSATAPNTSSLVGKKILVAYFSATNNTKHVAEEIAKAVNADLYRIEPADAYATNPYDSSDRIKKESYENLRPALKNPLPVSEMTKYDVIFVGSPIWWHQPAMTVCTSQADVIRSSRQYSSQQKYGALLDNLWHSDY